MWLKYFEKDKFTTHVCVFVSAIAHIAIKYNSTSKQNHQNSFAQYWCFGTIGL